MITAICFSLLLAFAPATKPLTIQNIDFEKAREAYREGNFEKAIELYTQLVEENPKRFDLHFKLGLSHRGAKQYDKAIAAFERADSVQSDPPFAQYEIGKTYLAMQNYDAAVKQYHLLQGRNLELAQYLQDLFSQELVEKHQLSSSGRYQVVEKKPDNDDSRVSPMATSLRPTIIYRERAKYTEIARMNLTQGTVVLSVVYTWDGKITDIRVIRALPDGLTRKAIEAVKKIRFQPAVKDGEPVSVRGNVEFNFTLY